jgi:SAM-dependent methyltransferase
VVSAADGEAYRIFHAAVWSADLAGWLAEGPAGVALDLSEPAGPATAALVGAGWRVLRADRKAEAAPAGVWLARAETFPLDWLRDGAVDAVTACGAAVSETLATELLAEELARVTRPGGRLVVAVDSLWEGLARLAHDARWAELADVPAADVVLVPDEDRIRRCFRPDELRELLEQAGLSVDRVVPRTVLTEPAVTQALDRAPERFDQLVGTELALEAEHVAEPLGRQLVAYARRPD